MKKTVLFFASTLMLASCRTDFYENDQRIIVEGYVTYGGKPLQNAEVVAMPVENTKNKSHIIEELNPSEEGYGYDGYIITKMRTNADGKISFSLPRNERTDTYVIQINRGITKTYGYISPLNTRNHYVDLGTLIFDE